MSDYDVIVVGAGNGGLTAAVSLAARQKHVLLLEKHNIPGGCATSFVRGRFEFEVALHQLSGMGTKEEPGPLRGLLAQLGVLERVEFVRENVLFRTIVPGEFNIKLNANRDDIVSVLCAQFPEERDAIIGYIDLVWRFCTEYLSIYVMKDPNSSPKTYPLYFKYALKRADEVLDQFFRDPYLKLALASYWGYSGLPPSRLPFSEAAIMFWAYTEFKPFHIRGGSQALSNALLDSFLSFGGEVSFNCSVREIIVENGKTTGVITDSGRHIGSDAVISNVGTLKTYVDLIDQQHVPESQFQQLRQSTVGCSGFTVYMGLNCEPGELGIDASTSFISTNHDMDSQYDGYSSLKSPEYVCLSCYDVADPEFSPPGSSQIALINLNYMDHWLTVPPSQYAATKFKYAGELIDLAEKAYPGIRSHLEEVEAATPITMARYLGHPGGAIYGFDQYAKDNRIFVNPNSPIDGLYFCGAWVASGGFQPTLESGVSAAKAAVKNLE